jgi:hypothetical protein
MTIWRTRVLVGSDQVQQQIGVRKIGIVACIGSGIGSARRRLFGFGFVGCDRWTSGTAYAKCGVK